MDKKKNTRESIISTAKNLFQKQGYHATGINQIIKESGAPKGSLYYHFPKGKEEIAIAAIDSVRLSIKQEIMEFLTPFDDVIEAEQAQIKHVASKILDNEEIEFRICLIALESANMSEGIREACKRTFDDWMSVNAHYLIKKGYSKEKAEQAAILINILIEGAITMSITYGDNSYFYMVEKRIPILLESL